MKKTKLVIIITSILVVFFSIGIFFNTSAQTDESSGGLEVEYPDLTPGSTPPDTTKAYLPGYIRYIYSFAVIGGGLIAFLALIIGGFRYLTSVGNPGAMADARERIFSGILGVVLIFGSYLILREINPDLTSLRLPGVYSARRGIIIYSDYDCGAGQGMDNPQLVDLEKSHPEISYLTLSDSKGGLKDPKKKTDDGRSQAAGQSGYTVGSFYSFHSQDELAVYFYTDADCKDGLQSVSNYRIIPNDCVHITTPFENITCVKMRWKVPGVWLFSYEWGNPANPKEKQYAHYLSNSENLSANVYNKTRSIALVRGEQIYYGAILHNNAGGLVGKKGWSNIYLPVYGKDYTVYNIGETSENRLVKSLTIFQVPQTTENTDGDFTLLCRNDSCGDELNTATPPLPVVPQLTLGWVEGKGNADIKLKDVTDNACSEARVADFSVVASTDGDPSQSPWEPRSICSDGNQFERIIGGAKLVGQKWKDEDQKEVDLAKGGNEIPDNFKGAGVSSVYLPENNTYMTLLFNKTSNSVDDFVKGSRPLGASAALVYGTMPSLSQLRWNDRVHTILLIRQASPQ